MTIQFIKRCITMTAATVFMFGCGTSDVETSNPEDVQRLAEERVERNLGIAIDNLGPFGETRFEFPMLTKSTQLPTAAAGYTDAQTLIQPESGRQVVTGIINDFETLITSVKHLLKDGATIGKDRSRVRFQLGRDVCDSSMVRRQVGQIDVEPAPHPAKILEQIGRDLYGLDCLTIVETLQPEIVAQPSGADLIFNVKTAHSDAQLLQITVGPDAISAVIDLGAVHTVVAEHADVSEVFGAYTVEGLLHLDVRLDSDMRSVLTAGLETPLVLRNTHLEKRIFTIDPTDKLLKIRAGGDGPLLFQVSTEALRLSLSADALPEAFMDVVGTDALDQDAHISLTSPGFIMKTELATPHATPNTQVEVRPGSLTVHLNSKTILALNSMDSTFYTLRRDKSGKAPTFKLTSAAFEMHHEADYRNLSWSNRPRQDFERVEAAVVQSKPPITRSAEALRSPHLDRHDIIERVEAENERLVLDRLLCITVPEAVANFGTAGLVMGQSPNELLRNWTCN